MLDNIVLQLIALGFYTLFIFFTFCDGFKLHVFKKLIWAAFFLFAALLSLKINNEFDLKIIIASSSLVGFIICWLDRKFKLKKNQVE
ncbi:MAG: hypothetical protein ISS47_09090 [Candidatus Omnitrophica bacterium]|nr:hypothetical protein [Candidatus Omnitrophota bacterium]